MITLENKTFSGDLNIVHKALERGENFAFSRFSDGEVYMLQKKEIILAKDRAKVGDKNLPGSYPEDDLKHYDPAIHEFYRQKLEDSLTHKQHNYIKGLSCRCCIADGEANFKWQLDLVGDDTNLSWANLFINHNYLDYLNKFIPTFREKRIVMILNKNGRMEESSLFPVVRLFPVGSNCMINDYGIIEEVKDYASNVKDHVFLCAASSLSNMIIHQCYSEYPQNTYIDIGSSLNPFIPGIGSRRAYMNQLSTNRPEGVPCVW